METFSIKKGQRETWQGCGHMLVKVTTVEGPICLFSSHLGGRDVWTEKPNYAWPEPRQVVAYEA